MVLMISTQEFERYVERCDDEEDYCTFTRHGTGSCSSGNASGLNASHASIMGSHERQKQVRFTEDPLKRHL